MELSFANLDPDNAYRLLTQLVIPRPVAWLLTRNEDGTSFNLAPFSYFSLVCHDPPLVSVSIARTDEDQKKDSLRNIERTGDFVLHIAPSSMADLMTKSAYNFEYGESEVTALGLSLAYDFADGALPRVVGPKIAMYGTLERTLELGRDIHSLLIGEIKHVYCSDDAVTQNDSKGMRVDPKVVDPIFRLGGALYGAMGAVIDSPRSVVKPRK